MIHDTERVVEETQVRVLQHRIAQLERQHEDDTALLAAKERECDELRGALHATRLASNTLR